MIRLSEHAVSRYLERVRDVPSDLPVVIRHARIKPNPPAWYHDAKQDKADAWAYLGESIVFPLAQTRTGYLALTCVTRASCAPAQREYRNHQAKHRRQARAAHRQTWRERKAEKRERKYQGR